MLGRTITTGLSSAVRAAERMTSGDIATHVEVTSQDVAELACAMAGPIFGKTTGAQLPIDGGNDRVI